MLIVDDQHSVCVSLSYFLEGAGYKVLTAESGRAAVALAETETFDGVLIDVHMPGMNGFDACIALQSRGVALSRADRVWFMTGAFTRDLESRCNELGGLGVFRKPFDFPAFLERLEAGFTAPASATPLPPPPSLSCIIDDGIDRNGAP